MITIIPSQEVLESFFDININSNPGRIRSDAFEKANLLKVISKTDVEIVVEGNAFKRIEPKMRPAHKMLFERNCSVDNSGIELFL